MFGLQATAYGREFGAGLYDRAVCAGTDEAHMLVRREDISAVSQLMDQKVYRQFRKKYEGWDRQENLEFDTRVAGRDGRCSGKIMWRIS